MVAVSRCKGPTVSASVRRAPAVQSVQQSQRSYTISPTSPRLQRSRFQCIQSMRQVARLLDLFLSYSRRLWLRPLLHLGSFLLPLFPGVLKLTSFLSFLARLRLRPQAPAVFLFHFELAGGLVPTSGPKRPSAPRGVGLRCMPLLLSWCICRIPSITSWPKPQA